MQPLFIQPKVMPERKVFVYGPIPNTSQVGIYVVQSQSEKQLEKPENPYINSSSSLIDQIGHRSSQKPKQLTSRNSDNKDLTMADKSALKSSKAFNQYGPASRSKKSRESVSTEPLSGRVM